MPTDEMLVLACSKKRAVRGWDLEADEKLAEARIPQGPQGAWLTSLPDQRA